MKRRKAFTLVELLIVVVIIGILANMGVAGYRAVMDRARNANVASNVRVIQQGLEAYAADHNGQPPSDNVADSNGFGSVDAAQGFRANSYLAGNALPVGPWSKLAQQDVVGVPKVLPQAGGTGGGGPGTSSPSPAPSPSGSPGPPGEVVIGIGAIRNPPSNPTDYGVVPYDMDPGDGTYVLYGVGKRGKSAVTAGVASNSGVTVQ